MWTTENRARYDRNKLRYPSDLTDEEWALIEPLIPPAKRGGNKRAVNVREVVNGLMYVLSTGCQWRAIPKDLAAAEHGIRLLRPLELGRHARDASTTHCMCKCREEAAREASPTAAIIDSQSVKSAEKGGPASIRMAMTRARVRLEGAHHLWRKVPSGELSIDPEADERRGWATGLVEAS